MPHAIQIRQTGVNQRFALTDAADAHKAVEARTTSGSTVLIIEPTVHRSFS